MRPATASRAVLAALTGLALASAPALAQRVETAPETGAEAAIPPSARRLATEAEQARWAAVGRLNIGGQGRCTATLIAPDLALTAGHCLVNPRVEPDDGSGVALWRASRLVFLAGWRLGEAEAVLRGRAAALPESFADLPTPANDMALIRLVPDPGAVVPAPIPVAASARAGQRVLALSYGRDRSEALSIEADCAITARLDDVLLTDCEATPGVSGAPLIAQGEGGPVLVGVIVAARDAFPPAMRGAALAVVPGALLEGLRQDLDNLDAAPE